MAQSFPGLRKLYPNNCLTEFTGRRDLINKARSLARDRIKQLHKRMNAENYTWRHHTWLDRIGEILEAASKLRPEDLAGDSKAFMSYKSIHYWNKRVLSLGLRSTGYFKWSDQQYRESTELLWTKLSGHLSIQRKNTDHNLIDFGCGTGRFMKRLMAMRFKVYGVDISRSMLDLARRNGQRGLSPVLQIEPCRGLPFKSNSINVLWSCTVLQHIPDELFDIMINELRRIVTPNGLVLLFENTHKHSARSSESGHVVFRDTSEYLTAFPGLSEVEKIDIEGEYHSIFVGRLQERDAPT